ncbi:hypothetical protein [Nocardiopsis sp. NPDC006938]|uniref:hypothetical protein n=1 Tax=Nocardiopsis sp. NPDC006938 TaxID=3364337 RepID=UPI0036A0C483
MTHHPPLRTRLLLIDGSPGATTLLVLAAHGAIPAFDAVVALDIGRNLVRSQPLVALRQMAIAAGMDWNLAQTGDTVQAALDGTVLPLPLFTLTPDGVRGRLPHGCARRQSFALTGVVRQLLGYPRPRPVPDGIVAECATGTALGQPQAPPSTGPRYVRVRHPLIEIGWTRSDCAAFLAHHELPAELDLACIACPLRSNRAWRQLREDAPAAFAEAVAVDTTLRHGHPSPARRGMPPGTQFFLHPDRVPLDQVDLTEPGEAEPSGCTPWTRRGNGHGNSEQRGSNR